MLTEDYTVRLDDFEGPLDLLLYLARKAEVDLIDLPLAQIADQYVEHLHHVATIDIDLAGEFLVMAATLMELKSRLISPAPLDEPDPADGEPASPADPEAVDLRSELIEQLLAYREIRDAADALEHRRSVWSRRYAAARAGTDRQALLEAAQRRTDMVDLDDVGLFDLIQAYEGVLERVDFDSLGAHHVSLADDDTPIELHAEDLIDQLSRSAGPLSLLTVFADRSRGERVGLFVATLELVRRRRILFEQQSDTGEIVMSLNQDSDESADSDLDDEASV
jgi:segregation and condensation protein A